MSIETMVHAFYEKFPTGDPSVVLSTLAHVCDVDKGPRPEMLNGTTWEQVKRDLTRSLERFDLTRALKGTTRRAGADADVDPIAAHLGVGRRLSRELTLVGRVVGRFEFAVRDVKQSSVVSLIVAMQVAGDDVVLAADRRGTYGDPRGLVCLDENMTKLHVCGNTVLGIVGMPGAILEPVRAFQAAVAGATDPIASLSAALRQHYEKNFGLRPFISNAQVLDGRPQATVLYADRRPGAAGLCTLPSELNFTPIPPGPRYVMAGVTNYALYLFQRLWRDSFSVDDALRLGAFLITETSKLDPKVGPIPDLTVLTAAGARQLDRAEIDKIVSGNDGRIARFASSFQEKANADA